MRRRSAETGNEGDGQTTAARLRESEERFRTLADNMSQLAWMADPKGWIFWYNRRWYEYTGTTVEEMQGWGWKRVHHPDHVDRVVDRIQHSWDTGEEWEDTFPLRSKTGEYRWFLSRAVPVRNEAGEITRWFGTNTDITEQRAAEEALKESDRRKDEFIATLAHELRNPLAPLRSGLEILHLARHDPDVVERAQQMMERQLTHMVRLIDDLLDLSRISRGIITLHKQRVALNSVLDQAVETTRPAMEEASHHFCLELPSQPLYVDGDPARLSQIFSNLLNNAAKFSERGASIWLKAEQQGDQIVVTVRDTGVGIPVDMLSRVFDMFIQAESGLERASGGLGIGLSLVKGLVEKHGGRVEARSAGPSLGSEFVVHLPAAAPGDIQERHPEQARVCNRRRKRILVVDDNRDAATSIAEVLELLGNETRTAFNGPDALELGRRFQPDVVLLDIGMPKMSGYEVAQCIREQDWGRGIAIAALTGWGLEEDRRRSREAGFDHHLVKPVDLSDLQHILQHEVQLEDTP